MEAKKKRYKIIYETQVGIYEEERVNLVKCPKNEKGFRELKEAMDLFGDKLYALTIDDLKLDEQVIRFVIEDDVIKTPGSHGGFGMH